jgi:hypothetical protein
VGTLIERGAEQPADHIFLVTSKNVSTLLVSVDPLSRADRRDVRLSAQEEGFRVVVAPGQPVKDRILNEIVSASSWEQLEAATNHPVFQLEPSTDDRPFFFNMLKFSAWRELANERRNDGVLGGNLKATHTLLALFVIVMGLIVVTIVVPLAIRGRSHGLPTETFAAAAAYFALIGLGFMLIEIGLMQKFSILLGHPIHSLAITLMSIILASGLGSLASDRIATGSTNSIRSLPLVAAGIVALSAFSTQWVVDLSISSPLALRVATVVAFTFPVAFCLGFFFPVGMRLLGAANPAAQSWMWGLNGALGVMGTLASTMISMTMGIRACLLFGALCYLLLALPMRVLSDAGRQRSA